MSHAGELTCRELVELVTDYVEGALSEEDQARFEEHLSGCEGCSQYVRQMRETIQLTGTLAEEQLEPRQRDRLREAFLSWRG